MEGFRRSRGGKEISMDFAFEEMSVTLPDGKRILSGVTGKISAGRVTAIMVPSRLFALVLFTFLTART